MSIRCRVAAFAAATWMISAPGWVLAVTVGTIGTIHQGENQFRTPVGVYGAVDVGNHEESGSTLEDLVGQGGNAITVYMSDDLAKVANVFTMTTGNSAGGGCSYIGVTQTANLNANTTSGVCAQIDNQINQGCRMIAAGTMEIIGPFLCDITHWEFLTGVVPAQATTVDITDVTDGEADIVDFFKMYHDGILIKSNSGTFSGVSNGTQMAAAIDALSGLIDASYAGNTLTITATSTGPVQFTDLHLEFTTPATTTWVAIWGLSDGDAALVNQFTLRLNGVSTDKSTLDFSVVTTVAQLAAELDEVPGIDVNHTGVGEITIAASNPGHVVFTNLGLHVRPELTTTPGEADFVENGSVVVDPGITASYAYASDMEGANAVIGYYVTNQDALSFTPTGGITGGFSNGTLTLSGNASLADYQTALQSITYSNSSDDPNTISRTVTFRLSDGVDWSAPVSRTVSVTAVNDAPAITPTAYALDYHEDSTTPVDAGLDLVDPDSTALQSATVVISDGFNASEDELLYTESGGISGSYAGGTLALSGSATVAAYESALCSVSYRNLSDAPDETARTVSFSAHDGSDGSEIATRQVTVTAVNDPPLVTTSPGERRYGPGQVLTVDEFVALEDADHAEMDSARVTISAGLVAGEDWLRFTDQNGIAGFYDDTTGVLDLIGAGSVADYQAALQSVAYENSNPSPDLGQRTVSFEVDDGSDWSSPATKEIAVFPSLEGIFVDNFESGGTGAWSRTVG